MPRCISFYPILSGLCALFIIFNASAKTKDINEIELVVNNIASNQRTAITQEQIKVESIVRLFYQKRNYKAAWPQTHEVSQVLAAIQASDKEGLYKEDYHYQSLVELNEMHEKSTESAYKKQIWAEFDVLLTDAVMLYAFHLINGKVDPNDLDTAWNYSHKSLLPEKVVDYLTHVLESGNIATGLDKFKPQFTLYKSLKAGLAYYQNLANTQNLIQLPSTILRAGFTDPNVILLRERLAQEGFDAGETETPELYDQPLKKQVMEFQELHGLEADGILGLQTIRALNVTFAQRADQIRINLERTRWVHNDIQENFVLVNIAGYQLYFVNNNELVWQTEVMVGKQQNATEIFRSSMFYMVFNPTWTVPRSIMRKGMIEKIVADPSYLAKHDFVLLNREGKEVDIKKVNWDGLGLNNFPYSIKQLSGPHNALGRVKFIFPNDHAIFLHDTPAKALFDKTQRAFSSGCVRVKNPLKLAELLLDNPKKWPMSKIQAVVDSKKMTKVELPIKREIMLMYWTAEPYAGNRIKFNPDIYERDQKLIEAFIKVD